MGFDYSNFEDCCRNICNIAFMSFTLFFPPMRPSTTFYLFFSLTQLVFFVFFGVLTDQAFTYMVPIGETEFDKSFILDLFQIISGHHLFLMILSFFMTTVNNHRARNSFNLALSILSLVISVLYSTKTFQKRFLNFGWVLSSYNLLIFLIFLILWIKKEPIFEKND